MTKRCPVLLDLKGASVGLPSGDPLGVKMHRPPTCHCVSVGYRRLDLSRT
jgi:hypothetical protein